MGTKDNKIDFIKGHAKKIVNAIAEADYESIEEHIDDMDNWSTDSLAEVIENFKEEKNIEKIDKYNKGNEHNQEIIDIYSDKSGCSYEYALTTDGEPNDLVLNLEFKFEGKEFKVVFESGITI